MIMTWDQKLVFHDFTMATLITIKSNHITLMWIRAWKKQAQIETLRSADFWAQRERERERETEIEVVVIAWIGGLFLGSGRGGARVGGARGREGGAEWGGRDDEGWESAGLSNWVLRFRRGYGTVVQSIPWPLRNCSWGSQVSRKRLSPSDEARASVSRRGSSRKTKFEWESDVLHRLWLLSRSGIWRSERVWRGFEIQRRRRHAQDPSQQVVECFRPQGQNHRQQVRHPGPALCRDGIRNLLLARHRWWYWQ